MTVPQAELLLTRLATNWPKAPLSAAKRLQYIACISDLPVFVGELAVSHALSTRTWLPEIAEFRRIVAELQQAATNRPAPSAAWQEFREAVHRYGMSGTPAWSHPAVKATADSIGFRDFCLSDTAEAPSWRSRFLQIYEAQAEQEVRDVQMLPSVRRGLAQLAESMNTWRLAIQAPAQPATIAGDANQTLLEQLRHAEQERDDAIAKGERYADALAGMVESADWREAEGRE